MCGNAEKDTTKMLVEQENNSTGETKTKTTNEKEQEVIAPKTDIDNNIRPFIHGRHTCDGCETTPIVGNRYQSVHNNDFDIFPT